MYVDLLVMDYVSADGTLTTFLVTPKDKESRVILDFLEGIDSGSGMNLGPFRVYDTDSCLVKQLRSSPRSIVQADGKLDFEIEHMGLPLGPSNLSHIGLYTLVIAPPWRLQELYVSDPYDKSSDSNSEKRQFEHRVKWDTGMHVQVVEMDLRSRRGSFSFVIGGCAEEYQDRMPSGYYVSSTNVHNLVDALPDGSNRIYWLNGNVKRALLGGLADVAECVDATQLEICGVKVNVGGIPNVVKRFVANLRGKTI